MCDQVGRRMARLRDKWLRREMDGLVEIWMAKLRDGWLRSEMDG